MFLFPSGILGWCSSVRCSSAYDFTVFTFAWDRENSWNHILNKNLLIEGITRYSHRKKQETKFSWEGFLMRFSWDSLEILMRMPFSHENLMRIPRDFYEISVLVRKMRFSWAKKLVRDSHENWKILIRMSFSHENLMRFSWEFKNSWEFCKGWYSILHDSASGNKSVELGKLPTTIYVHARLARTGDTYIFAPKFELVPKIRRIIYVKLALSAFVRISGFAIGAAKQFGHVVWHVWRRSKYRSHQGGFTVSIFPKIAWFFFLRWPILWWYQLVYEEKIRYNVAWSWKFASLQITVIPGTWQISLLCLQSVAYFLDGSKFTLREIDKKFWNRSESRLMMGQSKIENGLSHL